jgi:hypothetical protein
VELHVQPAGADVQIDDEPWISSEKGYYAAYVAVGTHRIVITLERVSAVLDGGRGPRGRVHTAECDPVAATVILSRRR